MEERGLKISRRKTEYSGCNEHQDAEIQLQGETVKRLKTFTYLGSTLAEDGELDAEVTQENEREDQGEGVQNSGKTSTDVRGRDMGVEEGTGKEIGGRINDRRMSSYIDPT